MALLKLKQINGGLELQNDVKDLVKILGAKVEGGTGTGSNNGAKLINTIINVQTTLDVYKNLTGHHINENDLAEGVVTCYLSADEENEDKQTYTFSEIINNEEHAHEYTVIANVVYNLTDVVQLLHNATDSVRQQLDMLKKISAVPLRQITDIEILCDEATATNQKFITGINNDTVLDTPKLQIIVNNCIYNEGEEFYRSNTEGYLTINWKMDEAEFGLDKTIATKFKLLYCIAVSKPLSIGNITFHDGTTLVFE